ncbi:MAG: family 20 glycosylhydrolase [Clostridiaceae bacterium]|jgi:hypothetical protein|nr:family 20 glycosylhydrolase [Clostridiaceae bacterium]
MRLYHLDLKTAMFRQDYLKDLFARLKTNGFDGVVVEIDNKMIFPSQPHFAATDALTADAWRDLVRYGKRLGLMIYPLLQTLGHMEHILRHEQYGKLAENDGNAYMLCPSKTESLRLVQDLIRDVSAAFDHPPVIHLGGDEVLGHLERRGLHLCPLCRTRDAGELVVGFLLELADFCLKLGSRPEFWADEILTYPRQLARFPKETRFVDWLYRRTQAVGDTVGHIWGAPQLAGTAAGEAAWAKLPERLRGLLPDLVRDGRFNHFYGAAVIARHGFQAVVGSALRSSGDHYAVPRVSLSAGNVAVSDQIAREAGYDHLVTSWAVRLNHPETTWIALSDQALGPLSAEQRGWLDTVGRGLAGIDILDEQRMRFERPFHGGLSQTLDALAQSPDRDAAVRLLQERQLAGEALLPLLNKNLATGAGDSNCLRHWLLGTELAVLRARQTLALLDAYRAGIDRPRLGKLLMQNQALMHRFEQLWSESVTPESLDQECEIKFRRDIRLLENMLCR